MKVQELHNKLIKSKLNLGLFALAFALLMPQLANMMDWAGPAFQARLLRSSYSTEEVLIRSILLGFCVSPLICLAIFAAKKVRERTNAIAFIAFVPFALLFSTFWFGPNYDVIVDVTLIAGAFTLVCLFAYITIATATTKTQQKKG